MNKWKLIKSPKKYGLIHMQTDIKMFEDFEAGLIPSTLRIYSWKPKCISLGYAQKIEMLIDSSTAEKLGWEVVKRPTGGGIVFHNEAEVTYSLVTEKENPMLPKGLVPSYRKLSEAIVYALKMVGVSAELSRQRRDPESIYIMESGQTSNLKRQNNQETLDLKRQTLKLCFSYPAEYEIVVGGRKIVGSAQKRGRRTLLQQGSIFVRRTEPKDFVVLKDNFEEYNAVSMEEVLGREVGFEELAQVLISGFKEILDCDFEKTEEEDLI
jgi:lipoate-protein ligase A